MSAPKDAIGNKLSIGQRVCLDLSMRSTVGYVSKIVEPSKLTLSGPAQRAGMPARTQPGVLKVIAEYTVEYLDEGPMPGVPGVYALRKPPDYTGPGYTEQEQALEAAKKEAGEVETPPAETTTPTESN